MITSSVQSYYRTAFGAAAREVIWRLYNQMMENLPGTRSGSDIEALHDMRVASRRLRAALRIFRPCLPVEYRTDVEEMVKSVTQALGVVRDHDVFIDYLNDFKKAHPDVNIKWLIKREDASRKIERQQMLEALDKFTTDNPSSGFTLLLENVTKTLADSNRLKKNQFGERSGAPVTKRIDALMVYDEIINDEDNVSGLHMMRIAAKKLRYTLEAFSPCFGEPFINAVNGVKALQEFLGQVHDCDVWIVKLNGYLAESRNIESLNALITERTEARKNAYLNALDIWPGLKENILGPVILHFSEP